MSQPNKHITKIPVLILALLIISVVSISIHVVYANTSFNDDVTKGWEDYTNSIDANVYDTYPFDVQYKYANDDDISTARVTINNVDLATVYGTKKDLVTYHGEVPYYETRDEEGDPLDDWDDYYAYEEAPPIITINDESILSTLSTLGLTVVIEDNEAYWGHLYDKVVENGIITDNKITSVNGLEKIINDDPNDVVSLRLYALANTDTYTINFGYLFYSLLNFFAWLSTKIIGLLISVKNIDMNGVMGVLGLDELGTLFTQAFIGESGHLSAFAILCIIGALFTIGKFTIDYLRGSKNKSLTDILATWLIGIVLIVLCLTNRITTLGSAVSNLTNGFIYAAVADITELPQPFRISVDDPNDKGTANKVLQLQEMSMVNKNYIDFQLGIQFDVNNPQKDLEMRSFGDLYDDDYVFKNDTNWRKLKGIDGIDAVVTSQRFYENFNNNLGYYFWFANSSAINKTHNNTSIPETNTIAVENKLNSMITYLQTVYDDVKTNPNISDTDKIIYRERILSVIRSFADPSMGIGALKFIFFIVCVILLFLVLWKYVLKILIAKLLMFIGLLAICIAAPIMLIASKKATDLSHKILAILLSSFLEITVYSIVFDIILFLICTMLTPDFFSILATIAVLVLLWLLNPYIQDQIKKFIDGIERSISPQLHQAKAAAMSKFRDKLSRMATNYDKKERVVGVDANGNEIRESRKGDRMSRLLHQVQNSAVDPHARKGFFTLHRELKKSHEAEANKSKQKMLDATKKDVQSKVNEVNSNAKIESDKLKQEVESKYTDTIAYDIDGKPITGSKGYHREKLETDEQRELLDELSKTEQDLNKIKDDPKIQELYDRIHAIDSYNKRKEEGKLETDSDGNIIEEPPKELSDEEKKLYEEYHQKQEECTAAIGKLQKELDEAIKLHHLQKILAQWHINVDINEIDGKTAKEKCDTVGKAIAQENAEEELTTALNSVLTETTLLLSDKSFHKHLKSQNKQIKDLLYDQAIAAYKLDQLEHGITISTDDNDIKKEVAETVDIVASAYSKFKGDKKYDEQLIEKAKQEYQNAPLNSPDREKARQNYEMLKKKYEDYQKLVEEGLIMSKEQLNADDVGKRNMVLVAAWKRAHKNKSIMKSEGGIMQRNVSEKEHMIHDIIANNKFDQNKRFTERAQEEYNKKFNSSDQSKDETKDTQNKSKVNDHVKPNVNTSSKVQAQPQPNAKAQSDSQIDPNAQQEQAINPETGLDNKQQNKSLRFKFKTDTMSEDKFKDDKVSENLDDIIEQNNSKIKPELDSNTVGIDSSSTETAKPTKSAEDLLNGRKSLSIGESFAKASQSFNNKTNNTKEPIVEESTVDEKLNVDEVINEVSENVNMSSQSKGDRQVDAPAQSEVKSMEQSKPEVNVQQQTQTQTAGKQPEENVQQASKSQRSATSDSQPEATPQAAQPASSQAAQQQTKVNKSQSKPAEPVKPASSNNAQNGKLSSGGTSQTSDSQPQAATSQKTSESENVKKEPPVTPSANSDQKPAQKSNNGSMSRTQTGSTGQTSANSKSKSAGTVQDDRPKPNQKVSDSDLNSIISEESLSGRPSPAQDVTSEAPKTYSDTGSKTYERQSPRSEILKDALGGRTENLRPAQNQARDASKTRPESERVRSDRLDIEDIISSTESRQTESKLSGTDNVSAGPRSMSDAYRDENRSVIENERNQEQQERKKREAEVQSDRQEGLGKVIFGFGRNKRKK